MFGTKQWRFAITLTNNDVLWCAYEAGAITLGIKVKSKFFGCKMPDEKKLSKTQPAAAKESYSRVASSSLTGRSEEHQLDRKSPWESENTAVKTLVWSKMPNPQLPTVQKTCFQAYIWTATKHTNCS